MDTFTASTAIALHAAPYTKDDASFSNTLAYEVQKSEPYWEHEASLETALDGSWWLYTFDRDDTVREVYALILFIDAKSDICTVQHFGTLATVGIAWEDNWDKNGHLDINSDAQFA